MKPFLSSFNSFIPFAFLQFILKQDLGDVLASCYWVAGKDVEALTTA